ncbi:MAG: hypothetical protein Q8L34_03325 [Candidatus Woesearchaeota archaeon]|nr:hypothetical protein [Candidatus Woesearchaeota archaeon]
MIKHLTAKNIGSEVYGLFHKLSEGLKNDRAAYLNPGDTIQTSGELDFMLYCENEGGVYSLRDMLMSTADIKSSLQTQGIPFPPLEAYREGSKPELVFIARNMDEAQVHSYGQRRQTAIPQFKPLQRKNLGAELEYCLEQMLRKGLWRERGEDIGPKNVPYIVNNRNGVYTVELNVGGSPILLKGLDIKHIETLLKR